MSFSYELLEAFVGGFSNVMLYANADNSQILRKSLFNLLSTDTLAHSFLEKELSNYDPNGMNQRLFGESLRHGLHKYSLIEKDSAHVEITTYHFGEQVKTERFMMDHTDTEWYTTLDVELPDDLTYTFTIFDFKCGNINDFIDNIKTIEFDVVDIIYDGGVYLHRHRDVDVHAALVNNVPTIMTPEQAAEFDKECVDVINSLFYYRD